VTSRQGWRVGTAGIFRSAQETRTSWAAFLLLTFLLAEQRKVRPAAGMDGWQYLRKTIQLRGYFDFGDCKQIVMLGFFPHHQPTHRPEDNFERHQTQGKSPPSPLL
jgi:hypothetical protein